ncbi:MAG: cysteine hydrolase family protein [Gemmatimonadota bacterium]|nr:MAG: cysteine hydrolase family protein [Gemmatimonadota bacterium]
MTRLIFWDVDTQYDFMRADGRLYVPDAEAIIPNLTALTARAHAQGIRIVASADDHLPDDEEISEYPDLKVTFPPHCLRGSPGQAKIPETSLQHPLLIEPDPVDPAELRRRVGEHEGDVLFKKHWFDVFTNPNVEHVLDEIDPSAIVVYGVALDVCVRYAVEGMLVRRPRTLLAVVADATKAIVPSEGDVLLSSWQERGVSSIVTADALRMRDTIAEEPHT